jgi:uncharacterized protein RhaS with RHS repeats
VIANLWQEAKRTHRLLPPPQDKTYLCQLRVYDPRTGRWLTRDPIGFAGGVNLYGYVGGKPVGGIDPEGLDYLIYRGKTLDWRGDNGELKGRFAATSGAPCCQNASYVNERNNGPLPVGDYRINLALSPNRLVKRKGDATDGGHGIERFPVGTRRHPLDDAWGTWRARLDPYPGQKLKRGNFYLHDSGKGYSSGCIEVTREQGRKLLELLKNYSDNGSITLYVRYASTGTSTNGSTGPRVPRGRTE